MDDELREMLNNAGCREILEKAGSDPARDRSTLVAHLGKVLANPSDSRRSYALAALRGIQRLPGADQMRIGSLLARYDPQDPKPADSGLPQPLPERLENPWWKDTLSELSDNAPRHTIIAYLDYLKRIFGRHLGQCANNSRREKFYQKYRCFFQQVLDTFEDMIPEHKNLLTAWITEADLIDLCALRFNAVKGARPEVWKQLAEKARGLASAGYQDNEDVKAARALADKYYEWRRLFDRCLPRIAEFKPQEQRHYPWLPGPESAEDDIDLSPQELQEMRQGLDEYGEQKGVEQYQLTLMKLQARLLKALTPGDSPTSAPADVVLAMRSARKDWAPALGAWPESEEWNAAQEGYEQELAHYSTAVLKKLRENCADLTQLEAILNDPRIESLKRLALPEVINFRYEILLMRKSHQDLEAWRKGPSDVTSRDLDNAAERLKTLKDSWCGTTCFKALEARYKDLRRELATLEEARRLYDKQDFEQAVRLLSNSRLPAATFLREEAQQLAADQRYINKLRSTGHEALTPEELDGASDNVNHLHERLRKGHEFFEQFCRRAASIPWTNGFEAGAREVISLWSGQMPDDAELTVSEDQVFEEHKDRLQKELDRQATSFLKDLMRRVKPFPLPRESVLKELETELRGFYKICDLPSMDSDLAEVWRRSVEAIDLILEVQRAAFGADWRRAEELLDEPQAKENLTQRQLAELRALLAVQELETQKQPAKTASNEDWLKLYVQWPAILLDCDKYRKHYLDLLRRSAGIGLNDHPGLLEDHFLPEEQELLVLVAAFTKPSELHDLQSLTELRNTPLVGHLLPRLVENMENYTAVKKLWSLLTASMRKEAWSEQESPVDKVLQRIEAEQKRVDKQLLDPAVPISDLQDLIVRHKNLGVPCDKTRLSNIDRATEIEEMVDKWNHQDPWDTRLLAELERARRRLELFETAIQEARGWLWAVDARRNGIRAWGRLEAFWDDFNRLFSERSTKFAADPAAWDWFKKALHKLDQALGEAISEIDWSLPGASKSARWVGLLQQWEKSKEGEIRRQLSRPKPENLVELRAAFKAIADQIEEFSKLHGLLLSDQNDRNLARLRDLAPLSGPVEKIRVQLINPHNARVGRAYKSFLEKQKKT